MASPGAHTDEGNIGQLASLVGRYVELRPSGRYLVGLCPFHTESEPSFKVNTDAQSWKCWGCKRWGDARDFLRLIGVAGPTTMMAPRKRVREIVMTEAMARAVAVAADLYVESFEQAGPARRYLGARRLDLECWRGHLGYAPGNRVTLRALKAAGLEQAGLDVGLLARGDDGPRDVFWNRVVFIERRSGQPVYLIGRQVPHGEARRSQAPARYLCLRPVPPAFGVDEALQLIRRCVDGPWCLLVEGVTDALAWAQMGVPAVALLGSDPPPGRLAALRAAFPAETVWAVLGDSNEAGQQLTAKVQRLVGPRCVRLPALQVVGDPADVLLLRPDARKRVVRTVLAAGHLRWKENDHDFERSSEARERGTGR